MDGFADRLRAVVADRRIADLGQFQWISLSMVKRKAGDEWIRIRKTIYDVAAQTLENMLGPKDALLRTRGGFVVIFDQPDAEAARLRAASMSAALNAFFQNDDILSSLKVTSDSTPLPTEAMLDGEPDAFGGSRFGGDEEVDGPAPAPASTHYEAPAESPIESPSGRAEASGSAEDRSVPPGDSLSGPAHDLAPDSLPDDISEAVSEAVSGAVSGADPDNPSEAVQDKPADLGAGAASDKGPNAHLSHDGVQAERAAEAGEKPANAAPEASSEPGPEMETGSNAPPEVSTELAKETEPAPRPRPKPKPKPKKVMDGSKAAFAGAQGFDPAQEGDEIVFRPVWDAENGVIATHFCLARRVWHGQTLYAKHVFMGDTKPRLLRELDYAVAVAAARAVNTLSAQGSLGGIVVPVDFATLAGHGACEAYLKRLASAAIPDRQRFYIQIDGVPPMVELRQLDPVFMKIRRFGAGLLLKVPFGTMDLHYYDGLGIDMFGATVSLKANRDGVGEEEIDGLVEWSNYAAQLNAVTYLTNIDSLDLVQTAAQAGVRFFAGDAIGGDRAAPAAPQPLRMGDLRALKAA